MLFDSLDVDDIIYLPTVPSVRHNNTKITRARAVFSDDSRISMDMTEKSRRDLMISCRTGTHTYDRLFDFDKNVLCNIHVHLWDRTRYLTGDTP